MLEHVINQFSIKRIGRYILNATILERYSIIIIIIIILRMFMFSKLLMRVMMILSLKERNEELSFSHILRMRSITRFNKFLFCRHIERVNRV